MAANKGKKLLKHSDEDDLDLLDAHIPESLRDPVLALTSELAYVGDIPTVYVGIVDESYTEEMWNCQAERLASLFNIDPNMVIQVKIRSRRNNTIDGSQLGKEMTAAINALNITPVEVIRIVGMGKHSAIAVHQALESLVRGWNLSCDQKRIQFVALGDSEDRDYLNLCKSFCLKQLCRSIQFYTTMDYNDFGFLDLESSKMSQKKLERILANMKVKEQNAPTGKPQ